jgi:hypothetical protein
VATHISAAQRKQTPHTAAAISEDGASKEKIEALAEIICNAGEESAVALLILMATLQNSAQANAYVNTAKHFAFTRCGELNVYDMVDAHIAMLADRLLPDSTDLH